MVAAESGAHDDAGAGAVSVLGAGGGVELAVVVMPESALGCPLVVVGTVAVLLPGSELGDAVVVVGGGVAAVVDGRVAAIVEDPAAGPLPPVQPAVPDAPAAPDARAAPTAGVLDWARTVASVWVSVRPGGTVGVFFGLSLALALVVADAVCLESGLSGALCAGVVGVMAAGATLCWCLTAGWWCAATAVTGAECAVVAEAAGIVVVGGAAGTEASGVAAAW